MAADFELGPVDAGHSVIHGHWDNLIAPRVIRLFRAAAVWKLRAAHR